MDPSSLTFAADAFLSQGDEAPVPRRTIGTILCCLCGVSIAPNAASMCVNCLRSQVDLTDGIGKQVIMHQCRGCLRYLRPPWVACTLESKELLAICLKKVPGLGKVKLIDAGFIWTEPHSKRIKLKLTIQKDVLSGVKLQQIFAVEFIVQNQQCDACQRSYTDHTWRATVQVRQKVEHKKTFYLLEQLILKHGMHEKCINVEQVPNGIDFFFSERSHALKFIDFLGAMVPIKHKAAKQLISEDVHTATKNYKFAYCVDVVPLCKDDLAVLPGRVAAALGNVNPLCLVSRVGSLVALLDPRSLQMAELVAEKFWAEPFRPLLAGAALQEFLVLDVTPVTIAPMQAAALRRKRGGGSDGSSIALSVRSGAKRGSAGRDADGGDADEGASTMGAGSIGGGGRASAGGFTGGVSLAGGNVQFNAAGTSVASTVTGGRGGRLLLADAEVMRVRDLGETEERFIVRTHLGNLIRAGDRVLGYDLRGAVYAEDDADAAASGTWHGAGSKGHRRGAQGRARGFELPDIVLVRKVFVRSRKEEDAEMNRGLAEGERSAAMSAGIGAGAAGLVNSPAASAAARAAAAAAGGDMDVDDTRPPAGATASTRRAHRERIWKLQRLDDVVSVTHSDTTRRGDEEAKAKDFEEFLREIESDPTLRKSLNLFKNSSVLAARARGGAGASGAADRGANAGSAAGGGATGGVAAKVEEDNEDEGDIGLEDLLDEMAINTTVRLPPTGASAGLTSIAEGAKEPGFEVESENDGEDSDNL